MEALAIGQPEQEQEQQRHRERLVELRRVQGSVERRADRARRVRIAEDDRPRHAGGTAVAAPRREAAQPPDGLAEGDAGGQHVRRPPPVEGVLARVPPGHGQGAQQPAVEHAAALQDRQQLARVARVEGPLHDHQHDLGAQQAADQHVHGHVGDARGIEAGVPRLAVGDPEAGHERDGQQHAVRVQREGAQVAAEQVEGREREESGCISPPPVPRPRRREARWEPRRRRCPPPPPRAAARAACPAPAATRRW